MKRHKHDVRHPAKLDDIRSEEIIRLLLSLRLYFFQVRRGLRNRRHLDADRLGSVKNSGKIFFLIAISHKNIK